MTVPGKIGLFAVMASALIVLGTLSWRAGYAARDHEVAVTVAPNDGPQGACAESDGLTIRRHPCVGDNLANGGQGVWAGTFTVNPSPCRSYTYHDEGHGMVTVTICAGGGAEKP